MDTIYTLPGLLLSVTLAFVVGRGINAAIAISVVHPQVKLPCIHPGQFSPLPISQRNSERASVVHPQCCRCHFDTKALGLGLGLPEEVPEWGMIYVKL